MDTESRRVLQFRCAETGRRFVGVFVRQAPSRRFRFINAIDEKDLTGHEAPAAGWKKPRSAGQLQTPAVAGLLGGATNLAQRVAMLARNAQAIATSAARAGQGGGPHTEPGAESFDINEFDFTGWYCPCCGYAKDTPVRHRFIRCGRCHEYMCGARVKQLPDGKFYFRCHDRCGHSGVLGEGTIGSMKGMGVSKDNPAQLDGKSSKLPISSQRGLPAGKDNKINKA